MTWEHTVIVCGDRRLEYVSQCEGCPQRKTCKHDCGHPGHMVFLLGGVKKVYWSGIIDQRKVWATAKQYLRGKLPGDVGGFG